MERTGPSLGWQCTVCRQPADYAWDVLGKELALCQACWETHKQKSFAQLWQELHAGKKDQHPWQDRTDYPPLRWYDEWLEDSEEEGKGC